MPKESMSPPLTAAEMAKAGQKQADAFVNSQGDMLKLFEQAQKDWMARVELERTLASELASKLTAAKSLPDIAQAYQEWMASRIKAMTEDSQKFFADSQKFMGSATRMFPSGWRGSASS